MDQSITLPSCGGGNKH